MTPPIFNAQLGYFKPDGTPTQVGQEFIRALLAYIASLEARIALLEP